MGYPYPDRKGRLGGLAGHLVTLAASIALMTLLRAGDRPITAAPPPRQQDGLIDTVAALVKTPPIGSVLAYAGDPASLDPASEWLACDGRELPKDRYDGLFQVVGDRYNTTQPPTREGYFRLPDYRNQFLRGATAERAAGKVEPQATAPPSAPFKAALAGAHNHDNQGCGMILRNAVNGERSTIEKGDWTPGELYLPNGAPLRPHDGHEHPIVGGDSETRPRNIAVNWIIRVKNTPGR